MLAISPLFCLIAIATLIGSYCYMQRYKASQVSTNKATVAMTSSSSSSNDDNKSIGSLIQDALLHHKNGNIDEAINAYEYVLSHTIWNDTTKADKLSSSYIPLCSNVGSIYMNRGDYEDAKRHFMKAVNYDKSNSQAYFNLAVLLTSKLKDHKGALTYCIQAVKLDRSNSKSLHLLGNIMQNLGRNDDAERYFIEAEALASNYQLPVATTASFNTSLLPCMNAKVTDIIRNDHITQYMECISQSPLIFRVRNILSDDECSSVISKSSNALEKSFIMGSGSDSYRNSVQAWLPTDELLLDIQQRLSSLLSIPPAYIRSKAEDLQVVKYDVDGEFRLHTDSSTYHTRWFTSLIYLNDVPGDSGGATWFPLAGGEAECSNTSVTDGSTASVDYNELSTVEVIDLVNRNTERYPGIKIAPRRGDAIIFFNHQQQSKLYRIDNMSVHAGLPITSGEKYIANYWVGLDEALLSQLL